MLLLNTTAYVSVQRGWGRDRELGKGTGDQTNNGLWSRLMFGRYQSKHQGEGSRQE